VNGGRTEYNNWEMDGGDAMDNGSNTTLNVYPSIDAIAEFKVLTSNYGAQYGRNGSGTVEVETKSGTSTSTAICTSSCATTFSMPRPNFKPRLRVQEERFRFYHRRPGLHSQSLQQEQAENFLFLVGGVASRGCAVIRIL
jgi:hypothetical protein